MWKHESEMRQLGFRRSGERCWRCECRHGLGGHDHLSVFPWSELALPAGALLVELTEFHVTFYRGGEHLHFYYHEMLDNEWLPAGYTSPNEIRRLGLDPADLRIAADGIALAVVAALGGVLLPRGEDGS
jgi:hypothetical protein